MKLFECCGREEINDFLKSSLKSNQVNFMKLLLMKEKDTKLSITLQPMEEYSDRYHGLHPSFDDNRLKDLFQSSNVNDSVSFWFQILKLQSKTDFTIFDLLMYEMSDRLTNKVSLLKNVLLARCIIQMSLNYGLIVSDTDAGNFNDFKHIVDNYCAKEGIPSELFIRVSLNKKDKTYNLKMIGIWPQLLINEVVKHFNIKRCSGGLKLIRSEIDSLNEKNQLFEILSFNDISKYSYIGESFYYSGVMPRVMKLDYKDNQASNSKIRQLRFHVCRTTYATVEMMDNTLVLQHPYFNDSIQNVNTRDMMLEFDHFEDLNQELLYHPSLAHEDEFHHLNQYLRNSMNTHTIAVSCNIKTSDGYIIAAKRNSTSIDAGEFYCTANGQSEFMDKYVSFYKESVFEDMPTMTYDSEYRVDLNNELRREVIAELGISSLDTEWDYLGVSFLSIDNANLPQHAIKKRRMHFNVLALNKTPLSFDEVEKYQKYATEKLENEEVIGIRPILVNTFWELIKKSLKSVLFIVNKYKSKMLLIIFLVTYLIARDWNFKEISKLSFNIQIDTSLAIIYLFLEICSLFNRFWKLKKRYFKFVFSPFYIRKANLKVSKLVDLFIKRPYFKSIKVHGIFVLMLLLTLREESK